MQKKGIGSIEMVPDCARGGYRGQRVYVIVYISVIVYIIQFLTYVLIIVSFGK